MWARVFNDALPHMRKAAPPGSRVLELGFGDGLLSCYLCKELGWRIEGVEVCAQSCTAATKNAARHGLTEQASFQRLEPEDILRLQDQYDVVFIKTVLYNSPDLGEYARWLDWIVAVLRPGGALINFDTGKANALTQLYRRARGRSYRDLSLFNRRVEALFQQRFRLVRRKYYGGVSQFFAGVPPLYRAVARLEEKSERHADNCFIVSLIGRKPSPGDAG